MQPRFTIIQGGLSGEAVRNEALGPVRAVGWRVVLRRAAALDEAELAAWRALAARADRFDPFTDPDYLVTAARHVPSATVTTFALAHAVSAEGAERLCGVLPLALPHPVWGSATVGFQAPALAPHPVEPLFEPGQATAATEAVLRHLGEIRPGTSLNLSRIPAEGAYLRALVADPRFQVAAHRTAPAIPEESFVVIAPRAAPAHTVRASAPDAVRDAVERFLLLDAERARRPLLPDPAMAALVRVATRLFARRGLVEVEISERDGAAVAGAIRLGRPGERVLWRSVGIPDDASGQAPGYPPGRPPVPRTADVTLALAHRRRASDRSARLRLVADAGEVATAP